MLSTASDHLLYNWIFKIKFGSLAFYHFVIIDRKPLMMICLLILKSQTICILFAVINILMTDCCSLFSICFLLNDLLSEEDVFLSSFSDY